MIGTFDQVWKASLAFAITWLNYSCEV